MLTWLSFTSCRCRVSQANDDDEPPSGCTNGPRHSFLLHHPVVAGLSHDRSSGSSYFVQGVAAFANSVNTALTCCRCCSVKISCYLAKTMAAVAGSYEKQDKNIRDKFDCRIQVTQMSTYLWLLSPVPTNSSHPGWDGISSGVFRADKDGELGALLIDDTVPPSV